MAQNPGLNLELIARDANNNPAKNRRIYVLTEIFPGSVNNPVAYADEHSTQTDGAGIFQVDVGRGTRVAGSFNSILQIPWRSLNYQLRIRVAIEPILPITNWNYRNEWIDMGVTPLGIVGYSGFALNADSVNPNNAVITFSAGTTGLTPSTPTTGNVVLGGVLSIANGGTGSAVKNFVDLTTAQSIAGEKTFSQLVSASAGISINNFLSIAGSTTPIRLNGNAGSAGQVLVSQGPNATPVWMNVPSAVTVKSKNRSSLLNSVELFDIPVALLDTDDGISIVLEAGSVPMPVPNYYIFRDIINNKVTVHFTAPFTGYVTWVIIE
ncbi:MAG: hypothetical protein ACKODS_02865 [Methylophilaceae bacterium]